MRFKLLYFSLLSVALLSSCYYDNEEDLYGGITPACDTTQVTFAGTIFPILEQANCVSCHSGTAPSAGIRLDSHAEVIKHANSGALLGVIRHEPAWSPMPKGGNKLSDCTISKIETWVSQGSPNN
jgi:mono/diheme cytochrome c family protein